MLDRTIKSFASGVNRVKWIATFLAERTKAETSIAKTLFQKGRIENKIDDLYRDIGRRVIQLSEKGEAEVFEDPVVQNALSELKGMKEAADEYKTQADNIKTNTPE